LAPARSSSTAVPQTSAERRPLNKHFQRVPPLFKTGRVAALSGFANPHDLLFLVVISSPILTCPCFFLSPTRSAAVEHPLLFRISLHPFIFPLSLSPWHEPSIAGVEIQSCSPILRQISAVFSLFEVTLFRDGPLAWTRPVFSTSSLLYVRWCASSRPFVIPGSLQEIN